MFCYVVSYYSILTCAYGAGSGVITRIGMNKLETTFKNDLKYILLFLLEKEKREAML